MICLFCPNFQSELVTHQLSHEVTRKSCRFCIYSMCFLWHSNFH